jgi:hypothetical protein
MGVKSLSIRTAYSGFIPFTTNNPAVRLDNASTVEKEGAVAASVSALTQVTGNPLKNRGHFSNEDSTVSMRALASDSGSRPVRLATAHAAR